MKIKLLYPEIRTSQAAYQTTALSLTVNLGVITDHTNVAEEFVTPTISLVNTNTGEVLMTDTVEVLLNSFSTEFQVTGLVPNTLHALVIDNYNNHVTTSIISTMLDTSRITVVGREKIFQPSSLFFGQDVERPVFEPGPLNFRKGLDLKNATVGSTVIIENGQIYTFCPTHVITTQQDYPNVINYRPLPGMPIRQIRVNVVPKIVKLTKSKYKVTPPTRMKLISVTGDRNIVTEGLVSEIDLELFGLNPRGTVLRPMFDSVP